MLKQYIPQPIKTLLKDHVWIFITDSMDRLTGKRDANIPPTRLMFDGPIGIDEYLVGGTEFFRLFSKLINPNRSAKILDIGSGIGRKTLPLTKYINEKGSYYGIEIVKTGVDWCTKHITKRFPNFHFVCVDIYNGFYNPKGKIKPNKFSFPYPDNHFDVVIATSVFTHMLPAEVAHYHKEVTRVLKKGGKTYFTYFLINPDSIKRLKDKTNTLPFKPTRWGYWATILKTPEIATAYKEEDIVSFYRNAGLTINNTEYGSWCGRKKSLSYQDIIIGQKK